MLLQKTVAATVAASLLLASCKPVQDAGNVSATNSEEIQKLTAAPWAQDTGTLRLHCEADKDDNLRDVECVDGSGKPVPLSFADFVGVGTVEEFLARCSANEKIEGLRSCSTLPLSKQWNTKDAQGSPARVDMALAALQDGSANGTKSSEQGKAEGKFVVAYYILAGISTAVTIYVMIKDHNECMAKLRELKRRGVRITVGCQQCSFTGCPPGPRPR